MSKNNKTEYYIFDLNGDGTDICADTEKEAVKILLTDYPPHEDMEYIIVKKDKNGKLSIGKINPTASVVWQ